MKTKIILIALFALSTIANAQDRSDIVPKSPVDQLKDSLPYLWKAKKVKTVKEYFTEEKDKFALYAIADLNNKGRITQIYTPEMTFPNLYYSFSGDTTIERSIAPYMGGLGSETDVTVNKYNSKHQLISSGYERFEESTDSMKNPENFINYNYEKGLLVSTTSASTGVVICSYDSHGNVIKFKNDYYSGSYRRVYDKGNLTEVYYQEDPKPEVIFEKFSYDTNGLVATYEEFDDKGVSKNKTVYKYNADKKLISMSISGSYSSVENYTYDTMGRLTKVEISNYDPCNILYNTQGLPLNYIGVVGANIKCVYTYWQ